MYHTLLRVKCDPTFAEILIAEISEAGFETFLEKEDGFEAYAEGEQFDMNRLDEIRAKYATVHPLVLEWDKIEKRNWNEEWEKSYDPIIVDDQCIIRAHFHKPERKFPYEIVITPKMSFGTGHHETTYLMVRALLEIDFKNKIVMDAGCGTGILSIMASKRGATKVEAFDIDEWSVANGNENFEVNACNNIFVRQGKISDLEFVDEFNVIMANINKNVLMNEIPQYAAYLVKGGYLLLSGFYEKDIPDLIARAGLYNLEHCQSDEKQNWASLLLQKR
jgi:ribosomal protein L11 methyltransferase